MQLIKSVGQVRHLHAATSLLVTLLVILASTQVAAADRRAAMAIDANTGKVLYASKADEPRHPASLTKMMTLYLVFEEIESGRLSLQTKIRMSERAASAPPSKLNLKPGEEISVRDAIMALTTKSANDIAVAIAEHIGGSEEKFAQMMTERAQLLGMAKTTFRNASGLPNREQVTTARDMLTLALHLQDDFPQHYRFFSVRSFTFKGRTYRTHNSLLRTFPGMDGLKTGYIRMSGFNVVSSVRRSGRHVVAAVFGGTKAATRNAQMRALLNRTLPKASTTKTRKPAVVAFYKPAPPQRAVRNAPSAPPQTAPAPAVTLASAAPAAPALPVKAPAAPAQSSWSEPAISIAKVRPVMVAPLAVQNNAGAAPALQSAGDQVRPQLIGTGTVPAAPGLRPSTLQQQAANLAQGKPGLTRLAAVGEGAGWGEAARLPVIKAAARSEPAQPAPAAVSLTKPAASGGYQIQVGAYTSATEAEKALVAALERSAGLLSAAAPVTIPVRSGARQLYRARFAGFNAQVAQTTCQELRRRQIDCFVAKAE